MSEAAHNFEEKLKELLSYANNNKGIVDVAKVNDFFKELNLAVRQIDKIYEYSLLNDFTKFTKLRWQTLTPFGFPVEPDV